MHAHARIHTNSHAAVKTGTNGPQWVGYKGDDVMSMMETVCLFTSDPFLTQRSFPAQRREKCRTKEKEEHLCFIFLPLKHNQDYMFCLS